MGSGLIRVAVAWQELAKDPAQLRRIAEACGSEPLIWDGSGSLAGVQVFVGGEGPELLPRERGDLCLLQCASAGVEWLQDQPIWQSDVQIANASGVHGVQIPEHVFALLLALSRNIKGFVEAQRRNDWWDNGPIAAELYGRTMGLVGYGHIGRGIAHLARAFGMRVLATSPSAREATPLTIPAVAPFRDPPAIPGPDLEPDRRLPPDALHQLLAASDVVVICAALTEHTRGLIDARALNHVKPGAYLINIARGKIIEETALVQALCEGRLAGAGLDVTEEEPLPRDSPLWDLPNVLITPHISGASMRYVGRVVNILLANIECLRRGEPPLTAVDRERGY
jgi:phosphoglycerate dehydrogenase-like enzyme